jgi:hypothetical protein
MNEEKYITGFNSGYILAEHKPALLQTVTQNLPPTNEYIEGLLDGKEQLENEKTQDKVDELAALRKPTNNRYPGMEMD